MSETINIFLDDLVFFSGLKDALEAFEGAAILSPAELEKSDLVFHNCIVTPCLMGQDVIASYSRKFGPVPFVMLSDDEERLLTPANPPEWLEAGRFKYEMLLGLKRAGANKIICRPDRNLTEYIESLGSANPRTYQNHQS